MGEVYLGEDAALNRRVAIKMLPAASGFDATANARLLREAQAAATLDHPHVCAVYVARRCAVHRHAAHRGREPHRAAGTWTLSNTDAVRIAEQVADALTAAHAAGIIHRDIKPGNIMLTARLKRRQAQQLAARFEEAMPSNPALGTFAARIRMAMGDHDRALEILTSVVDANAMTLFYKDQPAWKPIRRDERFQALLRRMRVPTD